MTASRFVFLATTCAALLAACAGCIGPTSPVAPLSHRGSSDLGPLTDPDTTLGTIAGELRRGDPLPADEKGLDTTTPWPDVRVEILDDSGLKVAEATSDAQGLFRLELAPGSYRVMPLWPVTRLYPSTGAPPNADVTVMAGVAVSVRLVYNPGIF
jgi:hypothetical protein